MQLALILKMLPTFLGRKTTRKPVARVKVATAKTQLIVDYRNKLRLHNVEETPVSALLEVNTMGVRVDLIQGDKSRVEVQLPAIGMSQPLDAKLFLFNARGKIIKMMNVELMTPEMVNLNSTARTRAITQSECLRLLKLAS